MAITVKHSKVSTVPDDADSSLVRPSDWNDDHVLTGTVPVANGGTGASTAADGLNALLPNQATNTGKVLTTDGTNATWQTNGTGTVTSVAATAGTGISVTGSPITSSGTLTITNTAPDQTVVLTGGTGISTSGTYPNFTITNTSPSLGGDVVGPASATDNAIARFDTTTGKLLQNSVVTVGDTGAITGITTLSASTSVTTPIVQATNSGGLALKNSAGTTQMSMGAGGGDNMSINVSTNLNGTNAQIDISPTGTGHVHMKPSGSGAIEIAPTSVGTMDNMTIGATTAAAGSFTNLSVTGTASFDGSQGTAGQVLTSAGTGATPTWTTPTTGTVTSVTGTAPIASSGGATPAISISQATTSTNGYLSSTDWNTFNNKGSGTVTSVSATAPITSSGGATPNLAMPAATGSVNGYLTSTDWTTFNSKGAGTVTSASVVSANGFAGTVATATTTPAITISTSITGVLKGNGTAISAATAGTDYVAPGTATTFTATQTLNGSSSTAALKVLNITETAYVNASAPTSTTNFYINTGAVQYLTSNTSTNWTLNFAFSSGTSLNTAMATGDSISCTLMATNSTTAYYPNAFTIDGTSVTPKWQGGTAPTSGNASSIDAYTFVIIKTASATYTVLASQTQFK